MVRNVRKWSPWGRRSLLGPRSLFAAAFFFPRLPSRLSRNLGVVLNRSSLDRLLAASSTVSAAPSCKRGLNRSPWGALAEAFARPSAIEASKRASLSLLQTTRELLHRQWHKSCNQRHHGTKEKQTPRRATYKPFQGCLQSPNLRKVIVFKSVKNGQLSLQWYVFLWF